MRSKPDCSGEAESRSELDKLNCEETAAYIGVLAETLRDRSKRRALDIPEPYHIGRKLYWRRSDLDPWIETRRERTVAPSLRGAATPRRYAPHSGEAA